MGKSFLYAHTREKVTLSDGVLTKSRLGDEGPVSGQTKTMAGGGHFGQFDS
jgi:hypothetical protein